jgi:hypothetical protein
MAGAALKRVWPVRVPYTLLLKPAQHLQRLWVLRLLIMSLLTHAQHFGCGCLTTLQLESEQYLSSLA